MPVQRRGMHALQIWCSRVTAGYPNVDITDLTSSFSDGLAFCAIIHHFRPELIDFKRLVAADAAANCSLAFNVAEERLGVPALLDPEDMTAPDKFSVVTYLSQFYHLFKDEDESCVSGRRSKSESSDDSVLQPSSSLSSSVTSSNASTPAGTPTPGGGNRVLKVTTTPRVFNHADLVAKYGEEIFSKSSPKQKEDQSVEQLGRDLMSKAKVVAER